MPFRLVLPPTDRSPATLPAVEDGDPLEFHRRLPGYAPTQLLRVPELAKRLGVADVLVKDEASRLGLPAFKMLGASWATSRAIRREWTGEEVPLDVTAQRDALQGSGRRLAAATDGNHGRGVARMAALLGLRCSIFVPAGTARSRIEDIEGEGAQVTVVDGSYDDAILRSAEEVGPDTLVVSDTSWPGYTRTPTDVINGYSTIFREIDETLDRHGMAGPSHAFFQSGVGSFAAAGLGHYRTTSVHRPFGVIVEPTRANCLMRSAEAGQMSEAPGPHQSTMAGLNCGLPSMLAWPVVYGWADGYLSVDDELANEAMRLLAGVGLVAGESGAASLAALLAIADSEADRARLDLDRDSVLLLVNTEGATDPVNYAAQVGETPATTAGEREARRARTGTLVLA